MTDTEYIIKLLQKQNDILQKIYKTVSQDFHDDPELDFPEETIDLKTLAIWIGESYRTTLPDLDLDSQFKGLVKMANNPKFETCLLSWLRHKKDTMPSFWKLTTEEQKAYYNAALSQYKDLICSLIQPKLNNRS